MDLLIKQTSWHRSCGFNLSGFADPPACHYALYGHFIKPMQVFVCTISAKHQTQLHIGMHSIPITSTYLYLADFSQIRTTFKPSAVSLLGRKIMNSLAVKLRGNSQASPCLVPMRDRGITLFAFVTLPMEIARSMAAQYLHSFVQKSTCMPWWQPQQVVCPSASKLAATSVGQSCLGILSVRFPTWEERDGNSSSSSSSNSRAGTSQAH